MNGMPIISNDLRSSCRALLLQSHMDGGSGEKEVEWEYPDYWPPLPDAGEGEGIFLIRPSENNKKFGFRFGLNGASDGNHAAIDWGDGNTETVDLSRGGVNYTEHEYEDSLIGEYVIIKVQTMFAVNQYYPYDRIFTDTGFYTSANPNNSCTFLLAASVGTLFCCSSTYSGVNAFNPIYVRFCMNDFNELSAGDHISHEEPYAGYYGSMFNYYTGRRTRRIDFTGNPTIFGTANNSSMQWLTMITGVDSVTKFNEYFNAGNVFGNCFALKKISFPSLTELPNSCFNSTHSLREAYLPKCKKIGTNCFAANEILQRVTVAKGCEIGEGSFEYNKNYVEIAEV